MDDLRRELTDFFIGEFDEFAQSIKWGIGGISGLHPLSIKFPKALSFYLPYLPGFEVYDEGKFHDLLMGVREQMVDIIGRVSNIFQSKKIKYLTIPQIGQDPDTLMAVFPHKLAAVRAGLGWIGKSSLLITEPNGPRVHLATILFDLDIRSDEPIIKSGCGSCDACVIACPYGCIKDVDWTPGIPREELLDAHGCSSIREGMISSLGHKDECGFCLLACPFGKNGYGNNGGYTVQI